MIVHLLSFLFYTIALNLLPLVWYITVILYTLFVLGTFMAILFARNQFASLLISTLFFVINSGRLSPEINPETCRQQTGRLTIPWHKEGHWCNIKTKSVLECSFEVLRYWYFKKNLKIPTNYYSFLLVPLYL